MYLLHIHKWFTKHSWRAFNVIIILFKACSLQHFISINTETCFWLKRSVFFFWGIFESLGGQEQTMPFFIWRHFFSCSWYEHLLVAIKDTHSHMITNILDHLKNSKHVLSFQRFFYYFFLSLAGVCKHVGALLYHISSEVREGNNKTCTSKPQA